MTKFVELLTRIDLTKDHILSFFLSGLKGGILDTIRLLRPATLSEAISLAKIQETALNNAHKRKKSTQRMVSTPLLLTPKRLQELIPADDNNKNFKNLGVRPFKKLSSGKLEEKRKKSLCYRCDEKYTTSHKLQNEEAE